MSRVLLRGFEDGSTSSFFSQLFASVATSPTRGSWSGYALGLGNSLDNATDILDAQVSEFYCGFGFRVNSVSQSNGINFTSPNNTEQVTISTTSGNALKVSRGGTVLATGTSLLTVDTWYYVEVYILISATVGKVQVKLNGAVEIAMTTGLNTKGDGSSGVIDRIGYQRGGSGCYFDDVYVNSASGARNNGYSGDIRVQGFFPNGNGSHTGLSATAGGAGNWDKVDERPPNTTDYVYSSAVDDYDLYQLPNTDGSAQTVQSVKVMMLAEKDDAGVASVAPVIKTNAGTHTGSDKALSTGWAYTWQQFDDDPNDSSAWTTSKIDGMEIGPKAR